MMQASLSEAGGSCSLSSKSTSDLPCDLELIQAIPANSMRNGDDDVSTVDHNGSSLHQSLAVEHENSVLPQCSALESLEGQGGEYDNSSKSHRETREITTPADSESITNGNGEPIQDREEDSISTERSLGSRSSGLSRSSRSSRSSDSSRSSGSSSLDSSYDTSSFDSSSVSSSVLTSSLSSFEFNSSTPFEGRQAARLAKKQEARDEDSESSNEDDLAKMISATMAAHGLALGQALAERASCVDSIKWLGQHLPETVVQFLIDEIEVEETGQGAGSERSGSILSPEGDSDDDSILHSRASLVSKANSQPRNDDDSYRLDCGESDLEDDKSSHSPIHYQQPHPSEFPPRAGRRHSMSGGAIMNMSSAMEVSSSSLRTGHAANDGQLKVGRRSSMPLILRSMEGSNRSIRDRFSPGSLRRSRRGELPSALGDSFSDASNVSGLSNMDNHAIVEGRHSTAQSVSSDSASLILEKHALGIGLDDNKIKQTGTAGQPYFDPFPFDSDDEKQKIERLREHRVMKTKDSIRNLAAGPHLDTSEFGSSLNSLAFDDCDDDDKSPRRNDNFYFTDVIPPATRHDCALLFVDISGFTKLSTTLGVEALSKTINSYFQKIVDMVEAFGGDILKFAGDALFAEWQATTSNPLENGDGGVSIAGSSQCSIEPWHGLGLEECVLTAAACGARIVDECSDYPVYESGGTNGKLVTLLNVHCGVGFGEVVGVHVGDKESRMEYLILGDPIEQVAEAIDVASRGEVVASPEALIMLEETAILDQCILESDMDKPQVIATKSSCFFRPKGTAHIQQDWTLTLQDFTTKPRERLAKRCDDWDLEALKRLKQRMSLYVHPVVVNDEFAMKVFPGDRSRAQERHRSEAELRGVFTVFIMPLITARLTGDDEEDCKVLVLLNDMMLIMTRELARFKGQMRQFIVDDKGVVLIANFGLRGSTFPNMVAERAIPFTTTFQTLLRTELNTECQMGATYGMAYCGVVGGVARHEYAVLGPSVNLAARLMANPDNRGFLVDDSVKDKAGSRQFRALPPVRAKGYAALVPIFEPMQADSRSWKDISSRFVGREKELAEMVTIAEDVIDSGGPSRFVLVSGEAGAGKSALCLQTMKQIKDMCILRAVPYLILRNVFSEGDLFVPFSLARPIFLDILVYLQESKDNEQDGSSRGLHDSNSALVNGSQKGDATKSLSQFVRICETAEIPEQYIDIITRLIVTRSRADPLIDDDVSSSTTTMMMNSIAQYLATAFLQCTIACDLVVLAIDDVSQMDTMSWKVVELLHKNAQNLMIVGTTRPLTQKQGIYASPDWWESLHNMDKSDNEFVELELSPMNHSDVEALIASSLGRKGSEIDPRISHEVFVQSGGMPLLASEILENLYKKEMEEKWENGSAAGNIEAMQSPGLDVGNIGELVLHRMDSLPASVRTHLNLGAILGSSFELMDVVTVFEQYRGVKKEERLVHAKSVHESLDEAVRKGILEVAASDFHPRYGSSDHPYATQNVAYKFTHDVWRSNILRLTLDEWKRDMHSLIAQSMETAMNAEFADDYRLLTKLFCHWKESGSAEKAATLALKIGRSLEIIGLTRQGLVVYHESLDMWKAMDNNDEPDESIGGLSMQLLGKLESSDVEHIIKLYVSLGRCYTQILDAKESIKAYQTALNFIHKAPSSVDLVDRSIIFPVFSGLFVALRFGNNEDAMYEQGLVRMFLRETKLYNDFHFSRALAMQAEMLGRHGDFKLALQTVAEMEELYHVEEHSDQICEAYGSDRSGQCISQSALWNYCLGNIQQGLGICDHVLHDLLPHMDPQNVSNYFQMLYPLFWVMKDHGRALEVKEALNEYVVKNYLTKLDERGLTSDRPLHMPIAALLDLIGSSCQTDDLQTYIDWAMVEKNGLFGSELNFTMGSCGRTADSITAEICLLLARHLSDRSEKTFLIRKGFELARDAMELTKEKEESKGMLVAYMQVKPIFAELEEMHGALPPERQSRRLSCRW